MGNKNRKWPVVQQCLAVAVLTALLAGVFSAAPADAASRHKASGFKPSSQVIFNDPRGSHSRKYAIVNEIIKLVNHAPPHSKIRAAYYWFGIPAVADALIAADKKRKVEVDVLLDKAHLKEKAAKKLIAAFKHGGKSKKSSVFFRKHPKRLMHVKLITFSKSGTGKNIVGYGSANLSRKNADTNGNDFRIKVNSPIYNCLAKTFDRLANPKNRDITYGAMCKGKGVVAQVTPVSGSNPWITLGINRINCSGGTKVQAVIMQWSDVAVAKAFVRKQAEGCHVSVLVNRLTKWISARVFKALRAKTKHGRVKVYVAKKGHGLHYKWMVVKGHKQAWVLTGSLHPAKGSQRGMQLVVREDNSSLANSYLEQFKKLTDHRHAKRRS